MRAPVVQITPQVGGTVLAVLADDTDVVKRGTPLVKLDPADARLALERAEAQLAQTVREVRTLYVNNAALAASVRAARPSCRAPRRRGGAPPTTWRAPPADGQRRGRRRGDEHAETTLASAKRGSPAAQSAAGRGASRASNRALTEGTAVEKHPGVQRAAAVREAWLALQRTELPAPVSGQVARRTVQVGQRVRPARR